jgi:hypothetical protein
MVLVGKSSSEILTEQEVIKPQIVDGWMSRWVLSLLSFQLWTMN